MFACLDLSVTIGPGAAFSNVRVRFRKADHPSRPQGPVGAVQPESTCAVRSPRPRLSSIARALRKLARYPRVWPPERRDHVPRRSVISPVSVGVVGAGTERDDCRRKRMISPTRIFRFRESSDSHHSPVEPEPRLHGCFPMAVGQSQNPALLRIFPCPLGIPRERAASARRKIPFRFGSAAALRPCFNGAAVRLRPFPAIAVKPIATGRRPNDGEPR
jgi:hypothetical protein